MGDDALPLDLVVVRGTAGSGGHRGNYPHGVFRKPNADLVGDSSSKYRRYDRGLRPDQAQSARTESRDHLNLDGQASRTVAVDDVLKHTRRATLEALSRPDDLRGIGEKGRVRLSPLPLGPRARLHSDEVTGGHSGPFCPSNVATRSIVSGL